MGDGSLRVPFPSAFVRPGLAWLAIGAEYSGPGAVFLAFMVMSGALRPNDPRLSA